MNIVRASNVKIGFKPYLLLNFFFFFSNTVIALAALLGIVILYGLIKMMFGMDTTYEELPVLQSIFMMLMLGALPGWIYFKSKYHFNNSKPLQESMDYRITDNGISVSGQTFYTSADWCDLAGAKEVGAWFVFFLDVDQAIYLPKRALAKSDIGIVKSLIKDNVGSKVKLAA